MHIASRNIEESIKRQLLKTGQTIVSEVHAHTLMDPKYTQDNLGKWVVRVITDAMATAMGSSDGHGQGASKKASGSGSGSVSGSDVERVCEFVYSAWLDRFPAGACGDAVDTGCKLLPSFRDRASFFKMMLGGE